MRKKNLLKQVNKILNENEYHLLVRDADKDGAGSMGIPAICFLEICKDYSLDPLDVLATLRKEHVYVLHKNDEGMLYFILVEKNGDGLSYGLLYCQRFGFPEKP